MVQLGLAMIPFGRSVIASGLTSATTSGTSGSIRNALELSTTTAPLAAATGPYCCERAPPAENSAMSMSVSASSVSSRTSTSPPFHGSFVPALRAEARKTGSPSTGKDRSSSRRRSSWPTAPVAPTTATRADMGTSQVWRVRRVWTRGTTSVPESAPPREAPESHGSATTVPLP